MNTQDYLLWDEDNDADYGMIVPIGKKPQKLVNKPKKNRDNVRRARKLKQQRQEEGE